MGHKSKDMISEFIAGLLCSEVSSVEYAQICSDCLVDRKINQ